MLSEIFFGKISFEVKDGFSDLFLSHCRKSGIVLNNLKISDNVISASVTRYSIENVFKAAEESGNTVKIIKRYGLPDVFIRYRKRLGIPLGLLVFAVILGFLGSFVWSVDISGTEKIPLENIERVLFETGIRKGALCENLQCRDAEFVLYNTFPEISWVNVLPVGSRVFVTVKERTDISADDSTVYSNIIAAKSGEIVRADIFVGEGFFYPGSAVEKGDMLASGVITFRDGRVKFVDCEGVVLARTKNTVNSFAPNRFEAMRTQVCKEKYLLYFFGLRIPLGVSVKAEDFTENRYFLTIPDIVLPLGLVRRHFVTLENKEIILEDCEAKLMAFYDFSKASLPLYKASQVIEREISFSDGDVVNFEAKYICVEDIAEKKIFTVNERDADLR